MAKIELINISKKFELSSPFFLNPFGVFLKTTNNRESNNTIGYKKGEFFIENLNLTIPDAKIMVILGPTGCGKTTILKIIAGLIQPDSGEIKYDGINMENSPPRDRKIGMVFQDYALYPHFTSKSNVLSYFLFKKKTRELKEIADEKFKKTSELLGVDITYLMDRIPGHLSGGEKQRVAIGRCITREPVLFLLDEPFSNLDQKLKEKYRLSLKTLLKHFNITTVYVTHDQQEAYIFADLTTIMNKGKIEQVGTFEDIYNKPDNIFVAEFLNPNQDTQAINLIDGEEISDSPKNVTIGVRPEDIEIKREKNKNYIEGNIIDLRNIILKEKIIATISINKNIVYAEIPFNKNLSFKNPVYLRFKKHLYFDKKSGQRISSFS